jgi:hypothetical protein
MSRLFISYSRIDQPIVRELAAALETLDIPVWYDVALKPGEGWERVIMDKARNAPAMVACWSPTAVLSPWVKKEAEIGLKRGVLAPIMIARCTLAEPFDAVHASSLTDWDGSFAHEGFQRLLAALERLLGKPGLVRRAEARAGGQSPQIVAFLRAKLVALARSGDEPLRYRDAMALIGMPIDEFSFEALYGALDAITDQNRQRREPPLSSLVVKKATGRPGRGYFEKHCFLTDFQSQLAAMLHDEHLRRVRAYDWPDAPEE